jgi:hypothetical protein
MSDDVVRARAKLVERTTQGLLLADILSINGTYDNCRDRMGSWSQEVAPGADLGNEELSVVRNDLDCQLTLTEIVTTGDVVVDGVPDIVLDLTYEPMASAFGSPVEFYGNAQLSAVDYAADFVITFLYSDDSNFSTAMNTAINAVAESSVTAEAVDAPDYTLDIDTLIVMTDVDDLIVSVTGAAGLMDGMTAGQTYVLLNVGNLGAATYADVETAFTGGMPAMLPPSIPASDFQSLVGQSLATMMQQVRTLIIANTENGITSYQVYTITFVAP